MSERELFEKCSFATERACMNVSCMEHPEKRDDFDNDRLSGTRIGLRMICFIVVKP